MCATRRPRGDRQGGRRGADRGGRDRRTRVRVEARGALIDLATEQTLPVGELIGVLIAIVLLTLLFRSAAAMGATLIGALVGVAVGQILLVSLSAPLGLPSFAAVIASMLGLGAGIDYALLIIGRYREQRAAGDGKQDAVARAFATAGTTVVAAGLIVMVAIAGLLVVGVPYIGKMGLGAAIAIGAVVVSALTILPIMIGALGRRLVPKKPEHVRSSPAFARWGEIVTRRPWVSIAAGVALLLVFAAPVTQMRLGQPDDGNKAESLTQRVAYDQQTAAFGPGSNGPLLLAVDTPKGAPATEAATRHPPRSGRQHARDRLGAAGDGERGRRDGDDLRHPHHRAPGRQDLRPARPPARRRHPGRDRRHAAEGLRRRQHRRVRGHHRQGRRAPAAVHLARDRPLGPAADDRVPLALDPACLGGLQPAVGRGRLRRRRGRVPGGHRREPDRLRLGHPDHLLPARHAVRDPVRAQHGLQRLPAQPDPRGLQRGRRATRERDPRRGPHRQGPRLRRPDHVRGVPGLCHRRRTSSARCSASASASRS